MFHHKGKLWFLIILDKEWKTCLRLVLLGPLREMIFIRCADNEIEYIRNKSPHIIKGIREELVGNQSFLSGGQV